jgi:hypothetical protein
MRLGPLGNAVRNFLTCIVVVVAGASSLPSFAGRLLSPDAVFTTRTPGPAVTPALTMKVAGGVVVVVEFYNAGLDHYFISADPAEIAVLDGGAFGGAWKRTGGTFPAWDVVGAPAGTVPVCRFFGTDRYRADGSRIGPNSHFYTADPNECAFVKTAWQSVASDGVSYPAWTFESNAFAVKLPIGGACPTGTQPLYRSYNNGARGDPNHRYSTRADLLQAMAGWVFEGLVMCLPEGQGATLPPQLAACGGADCPAYTPLGSGYLVDVVVEIANTTTTPLELTVPAGQTFIATPNVYQDGLAVERLQATIAPGTTGRFVLHLFCMQAQRGASKTGASYAPGPITGNAQLLDIIALADGKLGSVNDPATAKASAVQFAVWEITDGSGTLTTQQRNLLVSLLATPADDITAQLALFEQFRVTLSTIP